MLAKHSRRVTPTVIQMEAVECGAASLAIILAYYGKFVPLEELRIACGVSRDGASAASVVRAARMYGLEGRGFQRDVTALKEIDQPFIVFWAFQHFLVVERITTRFGTTWVWINDPEGGRRRVSMSEFDVSFTGIIITFERGPDFVREGRPTSATANLAGRWRGSGGLLWIVALASLLLVVPALAGAAFIRYFIDSVLAQGRPFLPLAVIMGVTAVLTIALTGLQQRNLVRLSARLSAHSGAVFFRHMLRLPIDFFQQRQAADLSRRVRSNNLVADILSRDIAATAVSLILVVFYALVLLSYDWALAVIGIVIALTNLFVLRRVARTRKDAVAQLRSDRGKLLSSSFNAIRMIESIKASGSEDQVFERWAGFQGKVVTGEQKLGGPTALLTAVPPTLSMFNSGVIILVGGLRSMNGALSVGVLVAFLGLLGNLSRPIGDLSNLGERLQDVSADLTRISDVERYPVSTALRSYDPTGFHRLTGHAWIDRVTFGYGPLSPPTVTEVSLALAPGRRTALVGGSGSGKSTIGKLLSGIVAPRSGRVVFDDRELHDITSEEMALSVAYVNQESILFEGTIRDNVTLWDPTVSDEDVTAALADAEIGELVTSLPQGFRSMVEEGGRNFSGGQIQRLSLARALVRNPTVLILDEAMSALDAETERRVDDNLRRRGCACLIIAHRLSTVRDADEIVVLKDGVVVERGTHDELITQTGEYQRLVTSS